MKKKLLALTLCSVMLFAVGCSNKETEKKEDKEVGLTTEQQENITNKLDFEKLFPNEEIRAYAKKMIGKEAPDFSFKNLKGEEVKLSDLKGKNVLVEIASTTCTACIQAYPSVSEFKKISGADVKVLTIFPNDKKEDVNKFFETYKYEKDEEVIAGEGMNNLINDYKVDYTPTFIFIDKKGIMQYVHVGGDINDVLLSSMSDLAFKTNISKVYNSSSPVELEVPTDIKPNGNAQLDTETNPDVIIDSKVKEDIKPDTSVSNK